MSSEKRRRNVAFWLCYILILALGVTACVVSGQIGVQASGAATLASADGVDDVAVLRHGQDADQIVLVEFRTSQERVLYAHADISDFALSGSTLAVILDDDPVPHIQLVDASSGQVESDVSLPGQGTVSQLHAGANGSVGLVFTSRSLYDSSDSDEASVAASDGSTAYASALLLVRDGALSPVLGPNGTVLGVTDWDYVPDTSSFLVLSDQSMVELFSAPTVDEDPVGSPLGYWSSFFGFVPESTKALVSDGVQATLIDLASGEQVDVDTGSTDLIGAGAEGTLLPVSDSDGLLAWEGSATSAGAASDVAVVSGQEVTALFSSDADHTITQVCLSRDGARAVVVEEGIGTSSSQSAYSSARVSIVDVSDGRVLSVVAGSAPDWCAR